MNATNSHGMGLDSASFRAIADLAYRESGLTLIEEKSSMIQSRLRHRLRSLGLSSFRDYCELVQSEAGINERRHFISALTTNVSHFFRENHHYDALSEFVKNSKSRLRQSGEMRIWSAGCSNGQEATSAAITLLECGVDTAGSDVRILGTDIDPEVIKFARNGTYPERLLGGVSDALRARYFDAHPGEDGERTFRTKEAVRSLLTFNELNLLATWPMKKRFDVIFCRNVVIYFDLKTQQDLWPRFLDSLTPEGILFLGHSERIADPEAFGFTCIGPTTYQRQQ